MEAGSQMAQIWELPNYDSKIAMMSKGKWIQWTKRFIISVEIRKIIQYPRN